MNESIPGLPSELLQRYKWILISIWTILSAGLIVFIVLSNHEMMRQMAKNEAITHFKRDQAFRYWATIHGGVYVPATKETQPNQYLNHIKERDIQTPSGKRLTLMNPAYMLRQLTERFGKLYGVSGHITSLKPLRPQNAPDSWEKKALKSFEAGSTEFIDFTQINEKPFLRFMRPMMVEKGCLKCHGHQGYKVGDVRGGVSIALSLTPFLSLEYRRTLPIVISIFVLWLIGLVAIFLGTRTLDRSIQKRHRVEEELAQNRNHLEDIVNERTGELQESNIELARLNAKLRAMNEEYNATNEELTAINEEFETQFIELKQAEEKIKASLKEKEVLIQEIHHRVKNNLQIVINFIKFQQMKHEDEKHADILTDLENRVRTMSLIHERLYRSVDFSKIDFTEYIQELADELFISYGVERNQITLTTSNKNVMLDLDRSITCGLIINELITNALKYAFPENRKGKLEAGLYSIDDSYELIVSDNGIGLKKDYVIGSTKSIGLRLIKGWVNQIDGKMEIDSSAGTKFTIRFSNKK